LEKGLGREGEDEDEDEDAAVVLAGPDGEAADRAEVLLDWFAARLIAARADAPATEADV